MAVEASRRRGVEQQTLQPCPAKGTRSTILSVERGPVLHDGVDLTGD
jgi:hypothetical protein